MKKARKHHYVSACYLKNFAFPRERGGRLYCLDKEARKKFQTTPNDACCERDFNRIEIDGVPPDIVEEQLAKLVENDFPEMLSYIEKSLRVPRHGYGHYNLLMTVMSLFIMRNQLMRSDAEAFNERQMDIFLSLIVSKPEVWNGHMQRLRKNNRAVQDVEYAEVRRFVKNREYKIQFPQEKHIQEEFTMQPKLFEILYRRKWGLLVSDEEEFISSNCPVSLVPNRKELMGMPLGFGMESTAVIFPLTTRLCLVGEFNGKSSCRKIGKLEAMEINGITAHSRGRFLYSRREEFSFLNPKGIYTSQYFLG